MMALAFTRVLLMLLSTLSTLGVALPVYSLDARSSTLTADQLAVIAPASKSCVGATHPDECRTSAEALQPILNSFAKYSIDTAGAQAAVLSTIAFESADFKFQKNYYPGNPGQGTRNMQSAAFNLKYAVSIPALAGQIPQIQGQDANAVRGLLLSNDDYDFGSAAWFLTTQCGPEVARSLADGSFAGYMAYLGCIGTPSEDARKAYWLRATTVLGVSFA